LKGKSPLHYAARFGNFEAVTQLVDMYKLQVDDVEVKTNRTALHISCSRGYMGVMLCHILWFMYFVDG
jgi:ankyrin repeat protein